MRNGVTLPGQDAPNPAVRFIVTLLLPSKHPARKFHEDHNCAKVGTVSCAKEPKTGLFADRSLPIP